MVTPSLITGPFNTRRFATPLTLIERRKGSIKKSTLTENQISFTLRQAESGTWDRTSCQSTQSARNIGGFDNGTTADSTLFNQFMGRGDFVQAKNFGDTMLQLLVD